MNGLLAGATPAKAIDNDADGWTANRDNIAPLRVRDLYKVYGDVFGRKLPPDEDGKRAAHIMLVHMSRIGPDAEPRMNNFLEMRTPWMSVEARHLAKEAAFRSGNFYGADELALEFGVTYAKRCALGLTTIGSIDVNAAQRKAIRAEKQLVRDREKRLRERLRRKPRPTQIEQRAAVIAELLPDDHWYDVPNVCAVLRHKRWIRFGDVREKPAALRVAVHRAIDFGVKRGLFDAKDPGTDGSTVRQVRRRSTQPCG